MTTPTPDELAEQARIHHATCDGNHDTAEEAFACRMAAAEARYGPRRALSLVIVDIIDFDPCKFAAGHRTGDNTLIDAGVALDVVALLPAPDGTASTVRTTVAISADELADLTRSLIAGGINVLTGDADDAELAAIVDEARAKVAVADAEPVKTNGGYL